MMLVLLLLLRFTTPSAIPAEIRSRLPAYLRASFDNFDGVIRGYPRPFPGPEGRSYHLTVWPDCTVIEAGANQLLSCFWQRHEPANNTVDDRGLLHDFDASAAVLAEMLPGFHATQERCESRNFFALRTTFERAGEPSLALRGSAAPGGYSITLDIAPYGHPLHLPSPVKSPPCW